MGQSEPDMLEEGFASGHAGALSTSPWRYTDMCRHWGVSRTTVERWVRRFERYGVGIPVHRDPSGRPYWLPHEAAATVVATTPAPEPSSPEPRIVLNDDERLAQLRRAARRR